MHLYVNVDTCKSLVHYVEVKLYLNVSECCSNNLCIM